MRHSKTARGTFLCIAQDFRTISLPNAQLGSLFQSPGLSGLKNISMPAEETPIDDDTWAPWGLGSSSRKVGKKKKAKPIWDSEAEPEPEPDLPEF